MSKKIFYKLIKPNGCNYMTRDFFYTYEDAHEYLMKMIDGTSQAIKDKLSGKRVAPLKTWEQLSDQLERLYEYTIEEVVK